MPQLSVFFVCFHFVFFRDVMRLDSCRDCPDCHDFEGSPFQSIAEPCFFFVFLSQIHEIYTYKQVISQMILELSE